MLVIIKKLQYFIPVFEYKVGVVHAYQRALKLVT